MKKILQRINRFMIIQLGMHGEFILVSFSTLFLSIFHHRMNHPIKRFKADDYERTKLSKANKYDLYSGQKHTESLLPTQQQNMPNYLAQNIKNELGVLWANGDESKTGPGSNVEKVKTESESEKLSSDNLFTSEGLQPSYADLNKIFDNSDDNSNDDHVSFNLIFCRLVVNSLYQGFVNIY